MGIDIIQVDAFTDRPFAGNPAAVCLFPEDREDEWMQAVAAEMDLAETVFLLEQGAYWQKQSGKDEMTVYQASARGGVVRVRVDWGPWQ